MERLHTAGVVLLLMFLMIRCTTATQKETVPELASNPVGTEVSSDELAREVREEVAVGREMAAKLFGHFGPYEKDDEALEYVNLVGTTLAQRVGRPELNFRFSILRSKELNAFATPGGYIFITTGLLKAIENESELAAILAHEIAHVNEKHMYTEISPKRNVSTSETVARMMSRGHSDLGRSISQIVNKGMKMLLEDGLGAEKEQQADEAALLFVSSLGYNPGAFIDFLKRVESNAAGWTVSKTTPAFPPRIANLENYVRSHLSGITMRADGKALSVRFKRALLNLDPKV